MQIELTIEEIKQNVINKIYELSVSTDNLHCKDSIEMLLASREIQRKAERLSEFLEYLHKNGGYLTKDELEGNF
jgi:predicted ATP-grasp superfamily ATP-dependent carboligase